MGSWRANFPFVSLVIHQGVCQLFPERYTIELLGTWEIIHNPDFKVGEFDHFKTQAGLPSLVF